MNPDSNERRTSLISAGSAVIFLGVFLWLGFGFFLSVGSALLGAGAAYLVFRPAFSRIGSRTRESFKGGPFAGNRVYDPKAPDISRTVSEVCPRPTGFWSALYFIYSYALPPYQRVASLLFLLQSAGSLAAIFVFCVVQSAGVDIHLFQMPSVARLFEDVYRIDPGNTFAKARFDNLFLPLVLVYVVSLPCLAASIIRNLPSILKDMRWSWRLLVPMAFFLFCLWLELFVRVPTRHKDLQQTIINGGFIGYVVLFVIIPMALAIIAAGLPLPRRQSQNIQGSHTR